MEDKLQNSISTQELFKQYDWYQNTFPEIVQNSCDEFFDKNFELKFIGLSKNINCLINNESCFVTKIGLTKDYDIFFRLTDKAIQIILNKILGKSKNSFNINKISELETKVITSFNGFMFEALKKVLNEPNPTELKRSNFDTIQLTFLIKDTDEFVKTTGKIIITLPQILLTPEAITSTGEKFENDSFPNTETLAKIIVGSTRFSLYDLKNLDIDDVVVFENSNIEKLKLSIMEEEIDFSINPNMDILIPQEDDGGYDMSDNHQNIWDSIEVEMNAEFDAVKIKLGELKDIEEGLVVDLTSLYDNNVTLKVEGKPIASGSLVIVNDRYGVKIDNVIAKAGTSTKTSQTANNSDDYEEAENNEENFGNENFEQEDNSNETSIENNGEDEDEEFDYSDFELEDENI